MSDKTTALITRARLEAPHSDDGVLLRELADALEAATVEP